MSLEDDIKELRHGDETLIRHRGGSILSGGQRTRICLARALYLDADIYLLDDPLSEVDPRTGKMILNDCIKGYLKNKTRILTTNQLQLIPADTQVLNFVRVRVTKKV